jgi:putative transposase
VIKDSAGRYFASFVITVDAAHLPETDRECGIDLGLGHFAVLDDGTKTAAPRFLRRAEKKLKRAQKSLSRKQDGSNRREKARVRVARQHAKAADARRDFHHKLSTKIIRENQAVYVENLSVKGLSRTRMAKSVHDAGWASFTAMLEYKAALHGRSFGRVGRFFPSSRVCSACGRNDGPKPLHVRTWTCSGCRTIHDRDVNAAVNIRREGSLIVAAGRAETGNARGGSARPQPLVMAAASETGSLTGAARRSTR